MISIIIPTLNAGERLNRAMAPLVRGVEEGLVRELIIADAGSRDGTLACAEAAGATIVMSALGEGAQSIAGAVAARARWLMFLHQDAALEDTWTGEIGAIVSGAEENRAFMFRIGRPRRAVLAEKWANFSAACLKTGPRGHGLLIARSLYASLGGYAAAPGAHRELLRRIGPGRLSVLRTRAVMSA